MIQSYKFLFFFVGLWAIYTLHWNDMKISIVDAVANIALGVSLLCSFYCLVICCAKYNLNAVFKTSILLMSTFSVYGLISILEGEVLVIKFTGSIIKNGTYLVAVLRSFLPIFVFYLLTKQQVLSQRLLYGIVLFFLILTIYIYFRSITLHHLISNDKDFVNNIGYDFLSFLPFAFYIRRTFFQYVYWCILLSFMFFALKRGPIVISIFLFLIFLFIKIKDTAAQNKLLSILLVCFILCVAFYFLSDFYSTNDLFRIRVTRTLAGNSSGRDRIVAYFIDLFNHHTSLLEYLFGLGADATIKYGINYAHNDWVEILVDQGIFGVSLYFVFWFVVFRHLYFMKDKVSKYVYSFIMLDLFLRTIFSMTYSMIPTATCLMLGYVIARDEEYIEYNEVVIQNK